MTAETFVKTARKPIEDAGVRVFGVEEKKLRALGREVAVAPFDKKEITRRIQAIFSSHYELDRHVWKAIEQSLR